MVNWGIGKEILKALLSDFNVQIPFVITQYNKDSLDKWHNLVYDYAIGQGIKTIEEKSVTFTELHDIIQDNNIDLLIAHAFMHKIPKEVFLAPRHGSINIHPSLLPRYRGPFPTFWIVKNRENTTGLTSHYIDDGIDTGDIISQIKIPINTDDTVELIIEKEKPFVEKLMSETLSRLRDENFKPLPQQEELASYAPRPEERGKY